MRASTQLASLQIPVEHRRQNRMLRTGASHKGPYPGCPIPSTSRIQEAGQDAESWRSHQGWYPGGSIPDTSRTRDVQSKN